MDLAIVAIGAAACMGFALRSISAACAAAVCGWMYPQITCTLLAVYLMGCVLFQLKKPKVEPKKDDDIIDAEYRVL